MYIKYRENMVEQLDELRHQLGKNINKVKPINVQKNKKYAICDIIKNSIYCQDVESDKRLISKIIDEITNTKDYRTDLLQVGMAISILDTNNINRHGLEIYVAQGKNISSMIDNPNFGEDSGAMINSKNILLLTDAKNPISLAMIFMHENIHKLKKMIEFNKMGNLTKAVEYTQMNIDKLDEKNQIKKFLNYSIFERLEENKCAYSTENKILGEYLAEIGKILIYCKIFPQYKEEVFAITKPMMDFFDQEFVPKLENFILKSPRLQYIELPKIVEEKIQEQIIQKQGKSFFNGRRNLSINIQRV